MPCRPICCPLVVSELSPFWSYLTGLDTLLEPAVHRESIGMTMCSLTHMSSRGAGRNEEPPAPRLVRSGSCAASMLGDFEFLHASRSFYSCGGQNVG